jgi:hypothetical protein
VDALEDLRKRPPSDRLGGVVVRWVDGAGAGNGLGAGSSSPAKLGGSMISCVRVSVRMKVNSGVFGSVGDRDEGCGAGEDLGASVAIFSFFFRRSFNAMTV